MIETHGDAHIWTALAYYIIGLVLLVTAIAVWWTHPINRVFIFGTYLTQEGMRVVMMSWPLVALFGAFIFSCAIDHHVEWLYMHGGREALHDWLVLISVAEAVISWLTAIIVAWLGARAVWRVWRK